MQQTPANKLKGFGSTLIAHPFEECLYTFRDAMAYLKVSRSTMWRLMDAGDLQGYRVGAQWRFSHEQLKAVLK